MNLSSNDYLGLADHVHIKERMQESIDQYGCGATSSRLVVGNHLLYEQVEQQIAALKGTEKALVFGSVFLANLGIIIALFGKDDRVISDKLCHASILDAIHLSRAEHHRYRHNDLDHLEKLLQKPCSGKTLIVTESVFSMDGDF
nr:aminotransferase class I/II-fold pyridoxal phosphate-dependent enzyme [Heliobacterium chlorum]